ncbi:pseudouridine kinase isoform X2 [Cornus florida]|uniref:pseudouridine kinase isoform X2 n=1 Tax=Cornus florida TaxID=4283 RepID=UPI002899205E|nr:pseudouridine kinase isoform X2 [Cornus florida]
MEGNVRSQMDSLSRRQSLQHEPNHPLHSAWIKVGQVKDVESWPVIIGGMVLDIHATPSRPANPRTTTPGKVHYILGGVARNVAECMSKLGTKPYMISAVGLDMAGIQRRQDIETAVVCNIFDVKGELAAAVACVEAIEQFLTPEWITQFNCNICSAPVLMVDANLSPPALETSCRMAVEYGIPAWFEPVSVAKSRRVASVVKYVTFASPNEDELIAMANSLSGGDIFGPIQRDNNKTDRSTESLFRMLKLAIWVLLEKGIKVLVVTLGSDGVFLCSKGGPGFLKNGFMRIKPHGFGRQLYNVVNSSCPPNRFSGTSKFEGRSNLFALHFPALSASVVKLTGAGDCLVGGTLASISAGLDVMQSVAVGIAAAKAAVEVESNVPVGYSLSKIAGHPQKPRFPQSLSSCAILRPRCPVQSSATPGLFAQRLKPKHMTMMTNKTHMVIPLKDEKHHQIHYQIGLDFHLNWGNQSLSDCLSQKPEYHHQSLHCLINRSCFLVQIKTIKTVIAYTICKE